MLPQHKTWSVFVLSSVVQGYKPGQDEVNSSFNKNYYLHSRFEILPYWFIVSGLGWLHVFT
jgi:hypothetical protein